MVELSWKDQNSMCANTIGFVYVKVEAELNFFEYTFKRYNYLKEFRQNRMLNLVVQFLQ